MSEPVEKNGMSGGAQNGPEGGNILTKRVGLNRLSRIMVGDEGPPWARYAVLGGILAIALVLPYVVGSDRWVTLLTIVLIYVVLSSGLNIVVGFTGLLDLGYAAFYAIGGYFTAIVFVQLLRNRYGVDIDGLWWLFWVNLLLGGLLAAVAGILIGYPTLRLRGDYLAIMTLAFHEIIRIVSNNWVGLTRGPSGISGVPSPEIGSFSLGGSFRLYYLALGIAVVTLFLIGRLVRSRIGRAWTAIREDEVAAEAMGIHTSRYKLLSYASGAFFAGVMGVFLAHYLNFIHPSNFKLMESFVILCLVVLGGMGSLAGPVAGAVIWISVQEWLRDFEFIQTHPEVRGMAMGAILVLLMVFRPQGIFGGRHISLQMRLRSRHRAGKGEEA
jgi:branched-chain amino acid transport system permease protein